MEVDEKVDSTSKLIHHDFPIGLRVLLVDHNPITLNTIRQMMTLRRYEVTPCENAVFAVSFLNERKDDFDIVLTDANTASDMDGFQLLKKFGLKLPIILMSEDDKTKSVMKCVENGACDYLIKPVHMETIKNLWQHVIRKKSGFTNFAGLSHDPDYACSENNSKDSRKRNDVKEENNDEEECDDSSSSKKPRIVWSADLHHKFVSAVNQLGVDKAVPKKILELMNVDELTRENVASHLQKYRLYLKRSITNQNTSTDSDGNPAEINPCPDFGLHTSSTHSLASQPRRQLFLPSSLTFGEHSSMFNSNQILMGSTDLKLRKPYLPNTQMGLYQIPAFNAKAIRLPQVQHGFTPSVGSMNLQRRNELLQVPNLSSQPQVPKRFSVVNSNQTAPPIIKTQFQNNYRFTPCAAAEKLSPQSDLGKHGLNSSIQYASGNDMYRGRFSLVKSRENDVEEVKNEDYIKDSAFLSSYNRVFDNQSIENINFPVSNSIEGSFHSMEAGSAEGSSQSHNTSPETPSAIKVEEFSDLGDEPMLFPEQAFEDVSFDALFGQENGGIPDEDLNIDEADFLST